jgi:uncharacterized protein (DUF2252 family)
MKQSFPSSLKSYVKTPNPSFENESERIIAVQQRMQYVSSSLLDSTIFRGESFVIQELQPMEDTFDFSLIKGNYRSLLQVVDDMAVLTASAQLRSGGREGSAPIDKLQAFGKANGSWKADVIKIAQEMAVQNRTDYLDFMLEYEAGAFGKAEIISEKNNKTKKIKSKNSKKPGFAQLISSS